MVPRLQAASAVQRRRGHHNLLPDWSKRGRQGRKGMEGIHQGTLREGLCRQGYIKRELSESLFEQGIHLVHGIKANMKNRLMPMWDKIMLRKRYVIECINELLKNKANIVHSRHRSLHNFIMNICSALTAYCSFDNKPEALPVHVENSTQLALF